MYSRAELLDIKTDERLNLMLVFPIDANFEEGRISVFDPLGAALLGRRVGDQVDWAVPYGIRRLQVKAVHFQPEAVLAKAA
jgi:regulator of nucleoside diphosphate kinase